MQNEERWRELIRQFDKLTDQDCTEADGNREQLIAKVSYKRSQDKLVARETADNADIEAERVNLSSI